MLVGCAAGFFSAAAWFLVTMWLRKSGILDWGLDTKMARILRMRDLVVEEDLAEAGWQKWVERRGLGIGGTGNAVASKKNR